MEQITTKLSRKRVFLLLAALLLIILSWQQVLAARQGLAGRRLEREGAPMRYMVPAGAEKVPGVLIAHGFSGSQQLMLGYGYTLAHAGYGVLLWDFAGHGANAKPLQGEGEALQENVDAAYAALIAQPEIDPARVAILGHSMGSGAAMAAGVAQPGRYRAVVAISPTGAAVTPNAPPNLLLQAGSLEPPFAENARDLLARAGGRNDDFAGGRARDFVLIDLVEHISILFNGESHAAARRWLARSLGEGASSASGYRDRRIIWYAVHLAGWLLAATAVSPLMPSSQSYQERRRAPWHWLGLAVAPFLAAGGLALLAGVIDLGALGGLLVGGALGLWFLLLGLIWVGAGFRPALPEGRDLAWGLALFALFWIAFGALGHLVWLPWLLIPARLARWPLLAAALLPWTLAAGYAQQAASPQKRFLWWLGQSIALLAGLGTAVFLAPELFFVVLVLPVLPIVIGIMMVGGTAVDRPWAYALGGAAFFAWLLVAVFPLSG